MTDISREAVESEFHNTKQPHGEMMRALRAALDTAEATIGELTAANIDLAADNARMVKRVDEARKEFQHIAKNWPDDFAARSARAWLAGGAA